MYARRRQFMLAQGGKDETRENDNNDNDDRRLKISMLIPTPVQQAEKDALWQVNHNRGATKSG